MLKTDWIQFEYSSTVWVSVQVTYEIGASEADKQEAAKKVFWKQVTKDVSNQLKSKLGVF